MVKSSGSHQIFNICIVSRCFHGLNFRVSFCFKYPFNFLINWNCSCALEKWPQKFSNLEVVDIFLFFCLSSSRKCTRTSFSFFLDLPLELICYILVFYRTIVFLFILPFWEFIVWIYSVRIYCNIRPVVVFEMMLHFIFRSFLSVLTGISEGNLSSEVF